MKRQSQSGFTLIELIIAMAIALILLGLGVPSFFSAVKNSKIGASNTDLVSALYLARSEATKRSGRVSVCARQSDASCGSDWNNGWILFTDNSVGSSAGTEGVIDGDDEVLRIYEPLENLAVEVKATPGHLPSSTSNAQALNHIQYRSDGSTSWSTGTFLMCDDRGEEFARTTNIVLTGDIRKGRKDNGSKPRDINGAELTCPAL